MMIYSHSHWSENDEDSNISFLAFGINIKATNKTGIINVYDLLPTQDTNTYRFQLVNYDGMLIETWSGCWYLDSI